MNATRVLHGVGVSPGCVVGPAFIVHWGLPDVPHRVVPEEDVESEIVRLRDALDAVKTHLKELRERTMERAGLEEAKIFEAQALMLDDPEFIGGVERLIRENQLSAERAFEFQALELRALWAESGNAALRQRRSDLVGIGVRVLQQLMGRSIDDILGGRGGRPVVVFTRDLTPGLTVEFDRDSVAAFASVEGTRTGHAAILAHSLGIPCVMGLQEGLDDVTPGTEVILDGSRGVVIIAPTPEEVADVQAREARRVQLMAALAREEPGLTATADGAPVTLRGNLDLPDELDEVVAQRADGVGLLRTEFLVLGRTSMPSEDEQATYFARVARRFPDAPIVVRSYDLGGDKFPAPFRPPREPNPFLGWRAIRVCLDQPELFRGQVRALLRARTDGDVQLMLPLITGVDEVEAVRALVTSVVADLEREGVDHRPDLPIGAMIETPAAAFLAGELAEICDFLSVGTNDLTQYALAVDRGNAALARRFTPFHPAVVRLLRLIAEHAGGHAVSICGEMASDPLATCLLLGLGFRTFSVAPPRISLVRWLIGQLDAGTLQEIAGQAVRAGTPEAVVAALRQGLESFVDADLLRAAELPDLSAPGSFID